MNEYMPIVDDTITGDDIIGELNSYIDDRIVETLKADAFRIASTCENYPPLYLFILILQVFFCFKRIIK